MRCWIWLYLCGATLGIGYISLKSWIVFIKWCVKQPFSTHLVIDGARGVASSQARTTASDGETGWLATR